MPGRRYVIEQIIDVRDGELPECSALDLFVATPRHVPGVQHVRLVDCEPASLRAYFHRRAGLLHGVPLVVDPGRAVPRLRLVFEVEQPAELSIIARVEVGQRLQPPLDFVLSANPPPSRLSTFLSGDRHELRPSIDITLHARRVDAACDALPDDNEHHELDLLRAAELRAQTPRSELDYVLRDAVNRTLALRDA